MKSGVLICMRFGAMSVVALTQSADKNLEPRLRPISRRLKSLSFTVNPGAEPLILFHLAIQDEKGQCKVHHHPLKVVTIPIDYGLLPGINERVLFPGCRENNSRNAITRYGGWLHGDGRPGS